VKTAVLQRGNQPLFDEFLRQTIGLRQLIASIGDIWVNQVAYLSQVIRVAVGETL